MNDLIQQFSLERVGKHGSKFDPEKAKWFNHQYMQTKSEDELAKLLEPYFKIHQVAPLPDFVLKVIHLIRERIAGR